jgi:cellulose synthase/poly-beta-1,6-N-acetylglucosamine synthase-like glycosyltransferase
VLVNVLNGVVSDPNQSQFLNSFVYTMDFIYILLIMTIVFFSLHLTNNNKRFKPYIYGISTLFGLFMICVFLVLVVDIFNGLINNATCNNILM